MLLGGRLGGASTGLGQQVEPTPYLVTPEWLAERLGRQEPSIQVIDASDVRQYRSAHIPGAIHSWWLETVERDYPHFGTVLNQKSVDGQFDDQGKRRAWLARHGIREDVQVVVYDRNGGDRAARIVWFLRFLGLERASALDSGFDGWQSRSLATTDVVTTAQMRDYPGSIAPMDGFYLATSQLAGVLETGGISLVDVRTDAERLDTVDGRYTVGSIPGSIRLPRDQPWLSITDPESAFDPVRAIAELDALGLGGEQRIVLYGRFGTDANRVWLVMKACGLSSVEIYDRGWVEWSHSRQPSDPLT
jgi:thiosulfate/3-mercaptopyruvate sulfurtransferase